MEDTRKGFLTPLQEEKADELIKLSGLAEKVDGLAIKLIDNQGLERLKSKLIEKYGEEALLTIYSFVDGIFEILEDLPQE